jgi:hypothetical protein
MTGIERQRRALSISALGSPLLAHGGKLLFDLLSPAPIGLLDAAGFGSTAELDSSSCVAVMMGRPKRRPDGEDFPTGERANKLARDFNRE